MRLKGTDDEGIMWSRLVPALRSIRYVCKGKTVPLQAWTGPEGSRRLRLPDFKTVGI